MKAEKNSDAAVIRIKGTNKGVAISTDCNGRYVYINPRQGEKSYPKLMKQIKLSGGSYPKVIKEMPGGYTKENIENYLATKNKPNNDELWDKQLDAFANQDKYEQTEEGFEKFLKSQGLDANLNPLSQDQARPTNKVK